MTSVVVSRWAVADHDLLSVSRSDGEVLGWVDPRTGARHPVSLDHVSALTAAIASWAPSAASPAAHGAPVVQPPVTAPAPLPQRVTTPALPWTDLAANAPGAAVRARAAALRQQAPVRTILDRALDRKTEERAWRIGAHGEEIVAARLRRLVRSGSRWRVLHAVPVGRRGADIDHVVIGPGGVFTLNAKHHPGATVWVAGETLLVNGVRKPYIRNSRHEAARAGRLLTSTLGVQVEARGVVVPVRADRVTVKASPPDVAVVPARRIVTWMRARPVVLDDQQVAALFEVARRSTTWQPLED